MLTDERKAIIAAEEHFRHEIRQKLESDVSKLSSSIESAENSVKQIENQFSKKLIEFLNSSIGLLLVSSVVVSGGGALYQQIQHKYEIEQKSKDKSIAYRFEIGDRIKNMQYLLRYAKTVGDVKVALGSMFKSSFPLNAELDNKSLSSLYFNLYQLIDGSDKDKSREAIELLRDLEDAEFSLQNRANSDLLDSIEKEQIRKLVTNIESLHIGGVSK